MMNPITNADGTHQPFPAHYFAANLTDRTTCGSHAAKYPAGVGTDASRVEKNQGAPWARMLMKAAQVRMNERANTIGTVE